MKSGMFHFRKVKKLLSLIKKILFLAVIMCADETLRAITKLILQR